jgi:predicted ATP-dependent endonuclease of OLD family
MGRHYDVAKMSATDAAPNRTVSVLSEKSVSYSGFHSGAGETTIVEFLEADLPKYGLILIDEIETSLHPRAQRRLIRDLAERCRERELQIILTTHSPYILDELPLAARSYISVLTTTHAGRAPVGRGSNRRARELFFARKILRKM